jgi:multidrug efflux pump
VSTIYTQLNQYHVVLEVDPSYMKNPLDLRDLFIRTNGASTTGSTGLIAGGSSAAQLYGPTSSLTAANTSLSNSTASSASFSSSIASNSAFGGAQIASTSHFPNGGQVPLSAFTHVEETNVPITVNHQGQFPVVTLSFNLAPGASLGDAVTAVNKVKDESHMPAAIQAAFQGTAASFLASLSNEPILILAAPRCLRQVWAPCYHS